MSTAVDVAPLTEPTGFRGEDQELIGALIQLQREAAARLDRLAADLTALARPTGWVGSRSASRFDSVRREALFREFKYLDGPIKKVIHAASGLIEEGVLTDAQRYQLLFGAGSLEGRYLTLVDLVAELRREK